MIEIVTEILVVLACILGGILLLWVLSLMGRLGKKRQKAMDGWLYAHRGYHKNPEAPENSLAAFERAVDNGFGIELDVHLLKDGGLGVFHDSSLKRMASGKGRIEDLKTGQLKNYRLADSQETIPTFGEVLSLVAGRVPMIIELKTVNGNDVQLCETVMKALEGYEGQYCIQSFDPRVVRWMKKNHPEIIRGQLSTNFLKDRGDLKPVRAFFATSMCFNFLTRPDYISYCHKYRRTPSNWICRHIWRSPGASWTLRSPKALEEARKERSWPIFEGFDPRTGEYLEPVKKKAGKGRAKA